jgi:hypothetical protein
MKHANPSLIALWTAAVLAVGFGSIAALRSLAGLERQTNLWTQKLSDQNELRRLGDQAKRFRTAVSTHNAWPSSPPPIQELVSRTLPGVAVSPFSFSDQPSVEHWTARRIAFSMTDVPGDSLDRFFQAASTARPPWSIEECTLQASTASGRLARVDLVLVGVERTEPGN